MAIGAVVLSAVLAGIALWLGGSALSAVGTAIASGSVLVLLAGYGGTTVVAPWNPNVAIFGVVALTFAAFAATREGNKVGIAAVPILSTVLVQSHVGLLPLCFWYLALSLLIVALYRDGWKPLFLGLALSALLWIPTLLQQVSGDEGNISSILSFLRGVDAPERAGLRAAVADFLRSFSASADWLPFHLTSEGAAATRLPLMAIPIVVVVVLALRTLWLRRLQGLAEFVRENPLEAFALTQAMFAPLALLALLAIRGPRSPHLYVWTNSWAAVFFVWSCALLAKRFARRYKLESQVAAVALVAVVTAAATLAWAGLHVEPPTGLPAEDEILHEALQKRARAGNGPVVLTRSHLGSDGGFTLLAGLVAEAANRGVPVQVSADLADVFPDSYTFVDTAAPHDCLVVNDGDPLVGSDLEGLTPLATNGTHTLYISSAPC